MNRPHILFAFTGLFIMVNARNSQVNHQTEDSNQGAYNCSDIDYNPGPTHIEPEADSFLW